MRWILAVIFSCWSCAALLAETGAAQAPFSNFAKGVCRQAAPAPWPPSSEAYALVSERPHSDRMDELEVRLAQAIQAGDRQTVARLRFEKGYALRAAGKPAAALDAYRMAANAYLALRDSAGYALAVRETGAAHADMGAPEEALPHLMRCLEIYRATGDKGGISNIRNLLGQLYYEQGDHKKALEQYQKAYDRAMEIRDESAAGNALNNLANIRWAFGEYPRAFELYQQSLALHRLAGDPKNEAVTLANIAWMLRDEGKFDEAFAKLRKSLALHETVGNREDAVYTLTQFAQTHFQMGDLVAARVWADSAEALGRATRRIFYLLDAVALNKIIAYKTGDYDAAWRSAQEYKSLRDSLRNEAKSRKLGQLEALFDYKQKQARNEIAAAAARRQRELFLAIGAGALAFLLAVSGLLFYGARAKRRTHKRLQAQNEAAARQRKEIALRRDKLRDLNEENLRQHERLEEAHRSLRDSAAYAGRIQRALVPATEAFLPVGEAAIWNKPRSEVSGDFCWTRRTSENLFCAVADSSGDGPSSAFLSVLGAALLDSAVNRAPEAAPDRLLEELEDGLRRTLGDAPLPAGDEKADHIDISLVRINIRKKLLTFAGAGQALYLARDGEIEKLEHRTEAAGAPGEDPEFPMETLGLRAGDRLFLCTGGLADQTAADGEPLGETRLLEILFAHSEMPARELADAVGRALSEWQGSAPQTDDQFLLAIAV